MSLTLGQKLLQYSVNIRWLRLSDRLKLVFKGDLYIWSHVVRIIAQVNPEALVTKYLLLVAENGICELGSKVGDSFQSSRRRGRDK